MRRRLWLATLGDLGRTEDGDEDQDDGGDHLVGVDYGIEKW